MRLLPRFKKLTLWNKLGAFGSAASVASLALTVIGLLLTLVAFLATLRPSMGAASKSSEKRTQTYPEIGREIKMSNSGKEVEDLVGNIEQELLPQGFKVEPRQRVFNEAGEQIAELDLVISGPLGSSSVRWLIECRDRPSEGSAPISWIEQLVARKERLQFDKVFAVSTTGFSPAARDFAKTKGIILRTVSRFADIKSDFMIQSMSFEFQLIDFDGPGQMQPADPKDARNVDLKMPMFRRIGDSEFLHLPVFVSRYPDYLYPIDQNPERVLFKYDDWLDVKEANEIIRVHLVRIPLRKSNVIKESKALLATIYAEDGKTIWLEGQFEADTPKGKMKSRVQILTLPDGRQSVQIVNDEVPDGYFPDSFSVYGRN